MTHDHLIFDRQRVRLHRDRASSHFSDFLLREMAERLADRLSDIKRTFPLTLDLGAHNGVLAEYVAGKNGIETLVQTDLSFTLLSSRTTNHVSRTTVLISDEEFLPFAENSFDLILSCSSLHWVNDLPGALIQIHRALKKNGLFLAMLPGGQTLRELRQSFEQAELTASGGISPRVSPFVDGREAGGLLQRAGFAEPVIDSELLTVTYDHPLKLLHELRAMGETNAMLEARKSFTPCSTVMLMADYYLRHFSDAHGRIPATFELVTMTGWK